MAFARNSIENKKYLLPNAFKKNGFGTYRFFFTGYERITNVARRFFVEIEQLNIAISPAETLFATAQNAKFDEADLQYALAGTESAKSILKEENIQPSYIAVRAGIFGRRAKQVANFFPSKSVNMSAKPFSIEAGNCTFNKETIYGKIFSEREELIAHPEFLCDIGAAVWELDYEIKYDAYPFSHKTSSHRWFPFGARTEFSGSIIFDGMEYLVSPEKSNGYIDFFAGKSFPIPLVHLSSSSLTSSITGNYLYESCFAVHGDFDGRLSVILRNDGTDFAFSAVKTKRKFTNRWDCVIMPEDEEGEKLHWSASVSNRQWIVDIDVYCKSSELFVREFELPEGNRKTVKVLCGGSGSGNVRIFKQLRKGIELIEEAHAESVLCEFGAAEEPNTEDQNEL